MKTQDYTIKLGEHTYFMIKAVDVDMDKAQKIAEILYPQFPDVKVISVTNDENTLTYRDYETLRMMVNGKLIACIRGSRTPYDELKHPLDVMYKTLLEKMNARIHQFQRPFCC